MFASFNRLAGALRKCWGFRRPGNKGEPRRPGIAWFPGNSRNPRNARFPGKKNRQFKKWKILNAFPCMHSQKKKSCTIISSLVNVFDFLWAFILFYCKIMLHLNFEGLRGLRGLPGCNGTDGGPGIPGFPGPQGYPGPEGRLTSSVICFICALFCDMWYSILCYVNTGSNKWNWLSVLSDTFRGSAA